jgi:hypothetical protein
MISKSWQNIVGKHNSKISRPYKLYNKKLIIAVFDNIFIQGLTFIKEDIIISLNERGFDIKDIQFKYKPNLTTIKKEKETKKITEKEMKIIESLISNISNEELKSTFEKTLKSYFKIYSLNDFFDIE